MITARIDKPTPTTVRTVAWISVGFAVFAVLIQVFYAVILAPRLPAEFEIAIAARYQSGSVDITPAGLAVFGFAYVAVALVAAVIGVVLARTEASSAYAFGVLICLFMPAWVGFILGSVISIVASPEGTSGVSGASLYLGLGVAIGCVAVYFAPRLYPRNSA
jgi:hypothetical protein